MLKNPWRVTAVTAAAILGLAPAAAAPIVFTSAGQSLTVLYTGNHSGGNISATVVYALSNIGTQFATFAITVDNTSTGTGTNRMSGFGIGAVAADVLGIGDTSGTWQTAANASFNGGDAMDFCARFQTGCSGAAAGQGLLPGDPLASFSVTMDFGMDGLASGQFTFDDFRARFTQVGTGGVDIILAGIGSPMAAVGITAVPEPGSLALAAIALLGMAASRRRPD